MRLPQRAVHLRWRLTVRKDESEIAGALWQRQQELIDLRSDHHVVDAGNLATAIGGTVVLVGACAAGAVAAFRRREL